MKNIILGFLKKCCEWDKMHQKFVLQEVDHFLTQHSGCSSQLRHKGVTDASQMRHRCVTWGVSVVLQMFHTIAMFV